MSGPFRALSDLVTRVVRVPAALDPTGIVDSVVDVEEEVVGSTADVVDHVTDSVLGVFDS